MDVFIVRPGSGRPVPFDSPGRQPAARRSSRHGGVIARSGTAGSSVLRLYFAINRTIVCTEITQPQTLQKFWFVLYIIGNATGYPGVRIIMLVKIANGTPLGNARDSGERSPELRYEECLRFHKQVSVNYWSLQLCYANHRKSRSSILDKSAMAEILHVYP